MEHQLMGPNLTQAEGFILGVGAKMFSCCGARHLPTASSRAGRLLCHRQRSHRSPLAGPAIVYGVSASVVCSLIYWVTTLF